MTLPQNGVITSFGSYAGFEQTVSTDNDGKFNFSYSLKAGWGVGSTNANALWISNYESIQYKDLYLEFNPVLVIVGINFHSFYLYKKIIKVVRKVKFDNPFYSGQVLKLITSGAAEAQYKNLNGPIAAGLTFIV